MLERLRRFDIKNIIWDADGTLVNLNHAYYCFIKNHPQFREEFKSFYYNELDKALPIDSKYGSIELKTHPTFGEKLDRIFCASDEYYYDRPFYYGTEKVLQQLNKLGYKQFVLSAGFNIEKKKKLLNTIFKKMDFIQLEVVEHDKNGMHEGSTKEGKIKELLQKYNLKKEETLLVDDRIYNIKAGLLAGVKVLRFRSEFTTPLPDDLINIGVQEIEDIREILL